MQNNSPVDPRTREELLRELVALAQEKGFSPRGGKLLGTLLETEAHLLFELVSRLNRAPQKHRAHFLNLYGVPRSPAHPAQTPLIFTAHENAEQPVTIPSGTLVSARTETGDISFRTRRTFQVQPVVLESVCWCDAQQDVVAYAPVQEGAAAPFTAWAPGTAGGGHAVEFILQNLFCGTLEEQAIRLDIELSLHGERVGAGLLADSKKFAWSVRAFPEADAAACQAAVLNGDGELTLNLFGLPPRSSRVCLRLELKDCALAELVFLRFEAYAQMNELVSEAVVSGDRALCANSFSPFQSPMRAYEECFLFCGEALSRAGASIAVRYTLSFDLTEEVLQKDAEQIDYKWIMRRPQPPPEQKPAEVFANGVMWEYWNGKAYCKLAQSGAAEDFSNSGEREIRFERPDDLASGVCGDWEGYFLRLSCGGCDGLYQLPRRVYSPWLENLRFCYWYSEPSVPQQVFSENFGFRRELNPRKAMRPFTRPAIERALFLCLNGVLPGSRLQLWFDLGERCETTGGALSAALLGGGALPLEDETEGFRHSGMIAVTFPKTLPQSELFGKSGCFLALIPPEQGALQIEGIYLNAQWAENRLRHSEAFSTGKIPQSRQVQLTHQNIVRLWVFVRTTDGWNRWEEGTVLQDGCYQADHQTGMLWFPQEIFAYAAGLPAEEDLIGVIYDTTDGANANLPAGALSRMQEEIPLIVRVDNPHSVCDGWNSESDAQLALRTEHLLACGGRAVSPEDYEMLAQDVSPLVRGARCIPGEPARLVILTTPEVRRTGFYKLRALLAKSLCNAGGTLEILPPVPVPIHCRIRVLPDASCPPMLESWLQKFINPLEGGFSRNGWRIGTLPTCLQLEAFIQSRAPQLNMEEIQAAACGGGLYGNLAEVCPQPWHIPGTLTIEWEVCGDDTADQAGR